MYAEILAGGEAESNDGPGNGDIEADIRNEIEHIKKPDQTNLMVQAVKLDVKCGEWPAVTWDLATVCMYWHNYLIDSASHVLQD